MTGKEKAKKRQSGTVEPFPNDRFFVFDKLSIRRHYPVNFILMGVLGDLCLSRINHEIFDYAITEQVKPLNKVFMCDIFPGPKDDPIGFLKRLYYKCQDYHCRELYFKKTFRDKVPKQKNINPNTEVEKFLEKNLDDLLTNLGELTLKERLGEALTKLGIFLFENYEVSETSTDIEALFSGMTDNYEEMDWIFYLGIPPLKYQEVIEHMKDYLCNHGEKNQGYSGPAKVFILEKPLQDTWEKADKLFKNFINPLHGKNGFYFFAVDHYAAKWALSQLPILNTIPNFSNFIDNVDEIIIELLESKDIPLSRMTYMAKTGLYFDMMTHILIPIQFLFSGKDITFKAKKIIFGYYEGYDVQIEKWLKEQEEKQREEEKNIGIMPETYFSLELKLAIACKKGGNSRNVKVFIRSGKGMRKDQKRVILKRQDNDKVDKVGTITIDINEDKFEPNQNSGVSLPPQIRIAGAASKHVRGYARVLYNVIEYLSSLQDIRDGKHGDSPGGFSHVMELLSVENAAKIIKCIENIKKSMDKEEMKKEWREKIEGMKKYKKNIDFFLDENAEVYFRYPLKYIKKDN